MASSAKNLRYEGETLVRRYAHQMNTQLDVTNKLTI